MQIFLLIVIFILIRSNSVTISKNVTSIGISVFEDCNDYNEGQNINGKRIRDNR